VKPALIAIALFVLFLAEACSTHRHSGSRASPPPPPPSEAAPPPAVTEPAPPPPPPPPTPPTKTEVPPPQKPVEPAPAVPDANKISLEKGMKQVEDSDLEGSLEKWAEGQEIDLKHVIKRTGVYVKVWHEVRWTDAKKRERDPADYDKLVNESLVYAKQLVDAATAGKTDQIKPIASQLADRCFGCHNKYK
jgi:hypothetical protein